MISGRAFLRNTIWNSLQRRGGNFVKDELASVEHNLAFRLNNWND